MLLKTLNHGAHPWVFEIAIPKIPRTPREPTNVPRNAFPSDFAAGVGHGSVSVRVYCCSDHTHGVRSIGDYNYFNWCFSLNGDTLPE